MTDTTTSQNIDPSSWNTLYTARIAELIFQQADVADKLFVIGTAYAIAPVWSGYTGSNMHMQHKHCQSSCQSTEEQDAEPCIRI
jgi:hypothetical protein